ncbi:FHY3/FAR1 family [Trema orientale]|uniref:FHY3/FAR1 family n=1 Tax=Trema orientale TaxID=63057 RepID=A0A2P5B5T7_TREOI|nr:FHY3/FAR1 family [Trema orientale]
MESDVVCIYHVAFLGSDKVSVIFLPAYSVGVRSMKWLVEVPYHVVYGASDVEDNLNKNNSNYYGSHLALHNLGEKIPSLSKEIRSKLPANEKRGEANCLVPQVGMRFSSEEEAYNFYKTYAKEIGFTVRKGKGFKSIKSPNKRKKRTETRIGCNANVQIQFENGKWVIAKCFLEHNHDLERPLQNHTVTCAENFEGATNDECRKIVEGHLETASTEIDGSTYVFHVNELSMVREVIPSLVVDVQDTLLQEWASTSVKSTSLLDWARRGKKSSYNVTRAAT